MFGFLKNLRGKPTEEKQAPPPSKTPPAAPAKPPVPSAAASPAPAAATAPPRAVGETLALSARSIFKSLPAPAQAKITKQPNDAVTVVIPLETILSQLSKGAVRISFGELRQLVPNGYLDGSPDLDHLQVDLPLVDILPRLKPGQLPRRAKQVMAEVPPEVAPIFGSRGEPLKPPAVSEPVKKPEPPQAAAAPAPPAAAAVPPPAAVIPSAPAPAKEEFVFREPPPPEPEKPIAAPSLPMPAPKAAAAPVPLGQASAESLRVKVKEISAFLAPEIQELFRDLQEGSFDLPLSELDQGIKKGKIQFTWGQLRGWLKGASPASVSMGEGSAVDLPLKVIVPAYMAARKPVLSQKKYVIGENIPDLFKGQPGAVAEPPPAPAQAPRAPVVEAPKPAPAAAAPTPPTPVAQPAPAPAVAAPALTPASTTRAAGVLDYGDLFGQPDKMDWSAKEIIQKIANFRGVAGALLVTTDGLLVAAQVGPDLNGETIAAFVPQMYTRIVQYTKELKLGEANQITLVLETVPLQIFKTGNVYLTVLGKAGENLPKPQLTAVAARLAVS